MRSVATVERGPEPAQRDPQRQRLRERREGEQRDRARERHGFDRPVDGRERVAVAGERERQTDDERDAGDQPEVAPRPAAGAARPSERLRPCCLRTSC